MKNSLLSEGWETDNLLPAGWLIKPDKHKVMFRVIMDVGYTWVDIMTGEKFVII